MSLLETRSVSIAFGGVRALHDVSIVVEEGELVGLIGPNGAGKTTLIRALNGAQPPDSGSIRLDGIDISRLPTHARVQSGLAMTHQIVRPFRDLTLMENVAVAAADEYAGAPFAALSNTKRDHQTARAGELLGAFGIAEAADQASATVPLGYLKRLEMARALATNPRIILLDEPLAGLNQAEATIIADEIVRFCDRGITVVLVEHNLNEIVRISRRLIVLDNGSVIAEGDPEDVISRREVRAAYFGDEQTVTASA